jgi:hypothetical protein
MAHLRRCGVAAVVTVGLLDAATARQRAEPESVRSRLHTYLSAYEEQLRTVIADERMLQWPMRDASAGSVYLGAKVGTVRRDSSRVRILESDVAFVSLPGNAGWLGYRDVRRVGGRAVRRRGPSLEDLLKATSDDARERAMVLLLESARHNLGAPRTINLPSLPLELLHRRNQARYVLETSSGDQVGDCQTLRIDLAETARPTIIQRPEGGDMPTRVSAWIEPETGRLCKAEVRMRDARIGVPEFTASVAVEFARLDALDLTVPVRMLEVFFIPQRSFGESEATYANYRRFTTSGRLLPPGGAPAPGGSPSPRGRRE